jgi:hypothetical protein
VSFSHLAVLPWAGSFVSQLTYPAVFSVPPVTIKYNVLKIENSATKWHNLPLDKVLTLLNPVTTML